MIYTFICPYCEVETETEHQFGAQACPAGHSFFTFRDYELGTVTDPPPQKETNPYAYFKREGE